MSQNIEMSTMPAAQNAPDRVQPETNFTDGSGQIFSFYLEKAEKDDDKMAESWKGDADGILVFTGLFSATVAGFLGISLQSLTQSSQDTSAFYIARLYQSSVSENSNASVPLPPLPDPSSFSPSASAIWVNVLWFLSLIISLTCALLATLLQRWARQYLRLTRPAYAPHKRARIRSYLKEGVDKFYLPSVVEALPGLLHASVFLFFVGLSVFLLGINSIVFNATLSCISVSAGLYLFASLVPLFLHDSPFHTPLSTMLWSCDVGFQRVAFSIFNWFYEPPPPPPWAIQSFILTLDEDHEIERLVAAIPGFYRSTAIKGSSQVLVGHSISVTELGDTIVEFMRRSLSSDMIPEDTAMRRSALCVKAFEAGNLVPSRGTLMRYLSDEIYSNRKWINYGVLASILTDNTDDKHVAGEAQYITARFTASIGRSDERWFPVMMRQFGVTEDTLQRYISHGDSLLLANLLYFVHRSLFVSPRSIKRTDLASVTGLRSILVEDTLPELQQQLCGVWNDVVGLARKKSNHSSDSNFRESHDRRVASFGALAFMHTLFVSLHPELGPHVPYSADAAP
ncbi:hypothetical protein BC834DRAFT_973136 [Gloeopeniophorella convolvens]|nr:hypothetical protein BC834DRAFT_973136 [Gloeopeniophorella convolvens]